jgi:hypothetical protein
LFPAVVPGRCPAHARQGGRPHDPPRGLYRVATGVEEVVSLVFGGRVRLSGVWIGDDVAACVARDPDAVLANCDQRLRINPRDALAHARRGLTLEG